MEWHLSSLVAVLLVTLMAPSGHAEETESESVKVLTPQQLEQAVKDHSYLVVTFYDTACKPCERLMPDYEDAAARLQSQDSDIAFAKLNAEDDEEFRITYGIDRYPTIRMYSGSTDTSQDYEGWRTSDSFVSWAKKSRDPGAREVSTVEEVEEIISKNSHVAVCFLPDPEDSTVRAFDRACRELEDTLCLITFQPELFQYYNFDRRFGLVLFKQYGTGREEMEEELSVLQIKKFITVARMDSLIEFNRETAALVFDQDYIKKFVVLFARFEDEDMDQLRQMMREVSSLYKNQIKFVLMNAADLGNKKALEFFDVEVGEGSRPCVRMVDMRGEEVIKYKPRSDRLGPDALASFVAGVERGMISPHVKIQPLPDDWDKEDVKILTGVNYKEVTEDPSKSVLVQFAAPWCGRCGLINTPYKKLAAHYRDHPDITIAKIDATANEFPFEVTKYPSFRYYPRGSDEVIEYTGTESTGAWIKFLDNRDENVPMERDDKDEL